MIMRNVRYAFSASRPKQRTAAEEYTEESWGDVIRLD